MASWHLDQTKFLTEKEMNLLYETAKGQASKGPIEARGFVFIDLALHTGLRLAEMRDLLVSDISFKSASPYLVVRHGKGDKRRTVILEQKLKKHLERYIWEYRLKPEDHLLTSTHGKAYTRRGLQVLFHRIRGDAGLSARFTVHSLRHSFASLLYARTQDLQFIKNLLGHSSILTTVIYANLNSEQIENKLNTCFNHQT